jgi:hypothetical protein
MLKKLNVGYFVVAATLLTMAAVNYFFYDPQGSFWRKFMIGVVSCMPVLICAVLSYWRRRRESKDAID